MPSPVRAAALAAALVLFTAAPAQAGFITYTFTSDSSAFGGSLTGSFRVDQANLLDGILSTNEITDYSFTFTAPNGAASYSLSAVLPDIAVNPATGVPLASAAEGSVLGERAGEASLVQTFLTDRALFPNESLWVALNETTGENDIGGGHWVIGEAEVDPVPAPAGALLGVIGVGCLGFTRLVRRPRP